MTEPPTEADSAQRSVAGPLAAIALLALLLRGIEAAESSLWLDELHTLSHASQPTLSAVVEHVHEEFHTPLFFAFVHLFGGFETGAWLRAIPVLSSVAMLWPMCAVARECGLSRRATLWMAWLYACLPYQILYGTELRPYAWIGVFSVLAFLMAFSEQRSTWARVTAFFASVLLGLLTHRIMALVLLALGGTRLLAKKPRSLPLSSLIAAGGLAVAGFLPWLFGFAQQATRARFDYQDKVGGYHLSARLVNELVSLPSRLVTPYLRELGGAWGVLALASTAVFALATCVLVTLAWRGRASRAASPVLRGLAIFAVAQFVLTTAFAVWTWDRVPLQYYTPMAWTLPLLVAACIDRAAGARATACVLGAASLLMGIALVGGKSREDMRGGIAAVRTLASEAQTASGLDPVYSALLAQPPQFANILPYRAYARELTALEPERVPRPGESDFERPLIVLRRVVPLGDEAWLPITSGRKLVREIKVDRYLTAYWFAP
jgi:uncharacterized membrane protein